MDKFRHIMIFISLLALPLLYFQIEPIINKTKTEKKNIISSALDNHLQSLTEQLKILSNQLESQSIDNFDFFVSDVKSAIKLQQKLDEEMNGIILNLSNINKQIENSKEPSIEHSAKIDDVFITIQNSLQGLNSQQRQLTENLENVSKRLDDISQSIKAQSKLIEDLKKHRSQ